MDNLYSHTCGHSTEIQNADVDNGELPELSEDLIKEIHNGNIPEELIPEKMYFETARIFNDAVGKELGSYGYEDSTNALASVMRSQIFEFSSSKSQAMHLEMRDALLDSNGKIKPFHLYQVDAKRISGRYVKHWLQAEYNTAISTTQMANKWREIKDAEELYPYLIYRTVGDGRVSDEHAVLNGLKLPVNHPRWNTILPPNRFNCRCWVEQTDDDEGLDDNEDLAKRVENAKIKPMFASNPGKQGLKPLTNIYKLPDFRKNGNKQLDPIRNYNMKTLDEIYQKNNFPIVSLKTKEEYEKWFDEQVKMNPDSKNTGFVFDDKITGRKIKISQKLKSKLPNKERYYGHEITNTLRKPDEIWTTSTRGTYKTVYIKYYNDNPYAVVIDVDIKSEGLKLNSFYEMDSRRYKELRKGILEFRKTKTAKSK